MNKKISDKDRKDWKNFISNKEKLSNKDLNINSNQNEEKVTKIIDLHGFSLEKANSAVEKFIVQCFEKNIKKIVVITGKGLRSKNNENPYISRDLSILKHSVPNFINSKPNLTKMIKFIEEADIQDGGQGAFYIFLKKFK